MHWRSSCLLFARLVRIPPNMFPMAHVSGFANRGQSFPRALEHRARCRALLDRREKALGNVRRGMTERIRITNRCHETDETGELEVAGCRWRLMCATEVPLETSTSI